MSTWGLGLGSPWLAIGVSTVTLGSCLTLAHLLLKVTSTVEIKVEWDAVGPRCAWHRHRHTVVSVDMVTKVRFGQRPAEGSQGASALERSQQAGVQPELIHPSLGSGSDTHSRPAGSRGRSLEASRLAAFLPRRFRDPKSQRTHQAQVAFQVCVRPGSYTPGPPSATLREPPDPHFSPAELEWVTKEKGATLLYALLVRVE